MTSTATTVCALAVLMLAAGCAPLEETQDPPDAFVDEDVGPFARTIAPSDVAILYPLPADAALTDYIGAQANTAFGPLVPEAFNQGYLGLIGLRIDPCSARAGGCTPEVRAVFQPIHDWDEVTTTHDGAVHVFYDVPEAELGLIMRKVLALKLAQGDDVRYPDEIGAHPILVATGLKGTFADGLRDIVLDHLGAQRVRRVTTMTVVDLDGAFWSFNLHERARASDDFVEQVIVGTETVGQVTGGGDNTLNGLGALSLGGTFPELGPLLSWNRADVALATLRAGFAHAVELQHPDVHSSESIDCISCHVADTGRMIGEIEFDFAADADADFTHPLGTGHLREQPTAINLHAFSYFGTTVSVMRRTANEAAVSAERMTIQLGL